MRFTPIFLAFICLSRANSTETSKDTPPLPSLDRIDYRHPERYLDLTPEMGNSDAIRTIARSLASPGTGDEQKLAAIWRWIDRHFKNNESLDSEWIDFDEMVAQHAYGGCATYSVLFGPLARAAGIPAVWVKSLDIDWLRGFPTKGDPKSWDGHVFLEVFVDGRWMLLNDTEGILYRYYDPRSRILPGSRLAYDKGVDPYALVLSMRWNLWKRQTRKFVSHLDLSELNGAYSKVADPVDIRGASAYAVCDNPMCTWLEEPCRRLGLVLNETFNTDFDLLLPKARGKTLIVLAVGDRLVLPDAAWPEYVGIDAAQFRKKVSGQSAGRFDHSLADGTKVIVLYGRTSENLVESIKRFSAGS